MWLSKMYGKAITESGKLTDKYWNYIHGKSDLTKFGKTYSM